MVFLFQYTWWESYNWFQYKLLLSLTETGHYYFRFHHHFNCLQIVRIVTLLRSQGLVTSRSIALSYKLSISSAVKLIFLSSRLFLQISELSITDFVLLTNPFRNRAKSLLSFVGPKFLKCANLNHELLTASFA